MKSKRLDDTSLSPMQQITKGYEKFIKGKELNKKGSEVFSKVLSKAAKPIKKQRGSK